MFRNRSFGSFRWVTFLRVCLRMLCEPLDLRTSAGLVGVSKVAVSGSSGQKCHFAEVCGGVSWCESWFTRGGSVGASEWCLERSCHEVVFGFPGHAWDESRRRDVAPSGVQPSWWVHVEPPEGVVPVKGIERLEGCITSLPQTPRGRPHISTWFHTFRRTSNTLRGPCSQPVHCSPLR